MAKKITSKNLGNEVLINYDGNYIRVRIPIALNQLALMKYKPDLSIEFIVLFEKFLVFYRSNNLRSFHYQQRRLVAELHIKRAKLEKARAQLIEAGFVKEVNPGNGKKIRYSLDRDKIISSVESLYVVPEDEGAKRKEISDLQAFFRFYFSPDSLITSTSVSTPQEVLDGHISIVQKTACNGDEKK